MNESILSIFYGLLAMIPIGIANAISKAPSQKVGAISLLFYRTITTSFVLLVVFLLTIDQSKIVPIQVLFAFSISSLAYLAMLFFYKALAVGKVGLITPTASSSVIISIALSLIFFKVSISTSQLIAIIGIIVGTLLVTANNKKTSGGSGQGLVYALLTALMYGFFFFLAQIPVRTLGSNLSALIFEVGILVFSACHLAISKKGFSLPVGNMKVITLIAILSTLSILGLYTGLKIANPSIVLTLSSAGPVVAVIYGFLVYRERLKTLQYISIALMIGGIILLSA